jgi:oxygen-independent coproporphyrinogen-3 oxidase
VLQQTDRAAGVLPISVEQLLAYDKPGPRYTSYPTAVEFSETFDEAAYRRKLAEAAEHPGQPLSLYVHLPFCEERCAFCGCAVVITKRREVAARYLDYVQRELAMLAAALGDRRRLVQLHFGGGTPTYLTASQLTSLYGTITRFFTVEPSAEVAIEIDPRVTTVHQLDALRGLGFNRLSMGVQDFTAEVQDAIGRHQAESATRSLYDHARALGFESINIDLIYGLPRQTPATFQRTLDTVADMRPDRLAVYSYAHVPWIRGNQKRIDPAELPPPAQKLSLLAQAVGCFKDAGYEQIGMDHFALPGDELAVAAATGALNRTFMGYTTQPLTDALGVGTSAIGDVRGAFAQNVKKLSTYYATLDNGRFPIERGCELDADDRLRRHVITQLMCNFALSRADVERRFAIQFDEYFARELGELCAEAGPVSHGFLSIEGDRLEVSPAGRYLVRNICMPFDRYLRAAARRPTFSRTI